MAARRYSAADRRKLVADRLADFRAKGVDAQQMRSFHPDGEVAALRALGRDFGHVRDQSQQQIEEGKKA